VDSHRLTLALFEAQVGSLVDVLPVALLIATEDGEVLRANAAAAELFGPRRGLVGQTVRSILPFMDETDSVRSVRGAIYSNDCIRPIDVRLRRLRHDGDVVRLYVIHEV
jgi:PAS domain-containing protein